MQTVIKDADGKIINVGPWDYQMVPLIENGEQVGEHPLNPLPPGAYEVQVEVVTGPDGGQYAATDYRALRLAAYPPIGDQLDILFHAGLLPPALSAQLAAVKAKYPKPSQS